MKSINESLEPTRVDGGSSPHSDFRFSPSSDVTSCRVLVCAAFSFSWVIGIAPTSMVSSVPSSSFFSSSSLMASRKHRPWVSEHPWAPRLGVVSPASKAELSGAEELDCAAFLILVSSRLAQTFLPFPSSPSFVGIRASRSQVLSCTPSWDTSRTPPYLTLSEVIWALPSCRPP